MEFFDTLPPIARGGKYKEIVDSLMEHRGKWAPIERKKDIRQARSFANNIRNGALVDFRPAGTFEAAAREHEVWVRYVGPEVEAKSVVASPFSPTIVHK